ncbi:hypothetical protein DRO64_10030 [Candidatus Bathyarchaeota archaeon]|nr:MAG: hypothetical protein DRO64_10030 [Candidatus Bathyarchaeota archaeon]
MANWIDPHWHVRIGFFEKVKTPTGLSDKALKIMPFGRVIRLFASGPNINLSMSFQPGITYTSMRVSTSAPIIAV